MSYSNDKNDTYFLVFFFFVWFHFKHTHSLFGLALIMNFQIKMYVWF